MLLRRFYDETLAQASYLVACEHTRVALIVDPNRDIQFYIDAAARDNSRIIGVTETHIHADFVSGSRELAAVTSAQLYLSGAGGKDWQYAFASSSNAELLSDGSEFMIGEVRVEAVHTPGHTPEHMSFLLTDTAVGTQPMGALTGDFIFVGDVGRPDLLERAAGMSGTMEAGARQLFQSLQAFRKRPDYLQIWPGHGAGSACGKSLGAMPQSTLGYEKLFNWALAEDDEERFVVEVLQNQPEPPAYFAIMKHVNREGPSHRIDAFPLVLTADYIARAIENGDTVLDTRHADDFAASHAKGTINIPRNKSFLNWSGTILPYDKDIFVIGDASEEGRHQLAHDLSLIGIERIAGVFPESSIEELRAANIPIEPTSKSTIAEVRSNTAATIVDVRAAGEFAAGHIPRAINIPLAQLASRLYEIPEGQTIVHCQGGSRSAIAASILLKSGRDDVSNMSGGFGEWERSGNQVERNNGRS